MQETSVVGPLKDVHYIITCYQTHIFLLIKHSIRPVELFFPPDYLRGNFNPNLSCKIFWVFVLHVDSQSVKMKLVIKLKCWSIFPCAWIDLGISKKQGFIYFILDHHSVVLCQSEIREVE